jgi:DNA-binding CsgD family transcriptional regulator
VVSYSSLPPNTRAIAEEILTRKQLDVFKLWANGYGAVRISLILGVSEATVRGHLRRSLQKLKPYYVGEAA